MAAEKKTIIREIGLGDVIDYKWLDDTPGGGNLGRAEFIFCPVWSRGIMRSLFIYPRQQRTLVDYYRLDLKGKISVFQFTSHTHQGVERPWCWTMAWCKEHRSVSYRVYVPQGTECLKFDIHFGDSIDIQFVKRSEP